MKREKRATRADVVRVIEERFPADERSAAPAAVDVYVHPNEGVRARTQLTILDRADSVAAARDLARHLLVESGDVQPPRDPQSRKNERYAG